MERAPGLLEDRSHSVLLAGVTLMLDICAQARGGRACASVPPRHARGSVYVLFCPTACVVRSLRNSLLSPLCLQAPPAVEAFRMHVPLLCKLLRSLIMGGFTPGAQLGGQARAGQADACWAGSLFLGRLAVS